MKAKRIFSLFLVLALMFGIGGSIVLAAETGADMNAPIQDQQETEQSAEGGSGETLPSVEVTNPPVPEVTNPPVPEVTNPPVPEATAAPVETPAPTESPEIGPPGMDGPGIEEPWGDGVFVGDNNPSIDEVYSAASGSATISVQGCYDSSGSVIKYYSSFYWDGRYVGGNGSARHILYANGSPAYCLEPGKYLVGGSVVSTSAASLWNSYSTEKRDAIKLALLCGVEGNSNSLSGSYGSKYTATQMVIWEFIVGVRNTYAPYTCTNTKVIDSVCGGGWNSEVKTVYNQIVSAMQNYNVLLSFCNALDAPPPSHQMTFQGGAFTVTLTDSNNVLSNFIFTSTNSALRFNAAGNKLTISSSSAISGATVNVTRKNAVSASSTITAYAGSGLQETIIGIEATGNTSGYFSVYAEPEAPPSPSPGNVKIIKTSDDGYVQGIYFTLSGMGKNLSGTTDASGYLTASNLEPGTYTVTESVPSDYTADKNPQTVTVKSGETATVYFHNSIKKSSFKIVKTSDDGAVSGIQFTITGPGVSKTVTTGADGTITVPDLPAGKYTITEQVPAGYTSDNASQQVTIMPGEFYPLYFHNTPELGEIKIVKTSDDGKVSRIQFRITGGETTKVGTTGADGTLPFRNLKPGTYTVTEVVPAGYTADHQSQVVTVKAGETATVNFHNTRKTGEIVIHKESEDGVVSGIQFRVQGEGIDQNVTTGSDGTINVPGLTPGEYTVTEIVPEGYVSDNASQTVTVGSDGPVSVYFKNTPKQWRVSVTKVDAEPNVRRSTRITLEGAQYGVYKDGTLRDTYTTDAHGQFTTNYYPCGTGWTLQEIKAPPGYTVDSTSYSIGLAPGSAQLAINETELTVPEKIIKGKLIITKQDANTKTPLEGALFRVFDEDGATVTEGTTGADGTFTVEELPFGVYSAQEITPPSGYMLDDTPFDFTVETDGQEIRITRDDYPAIGSITVHKVDSQGTNLSGAAYLLEYSVDGSGWVPVSFRQDNMAVAGGCTSLGLQNGQLVTGDDGTVFFDGLLADGRTQYRLTETQAPAGLSLLKDPIYVGTLPAQGESEAEYDITFTVTNNRVTTLPQTGGNSMFWPAAIGAALLGLSMCAGAYYVTKKMRKENH